MEARLVGRVVRRRGGPPGTGVRRARGAPRPRRAASWAGDTTSGPLNSYSAPLLSGPARAYPWICAHPGTGRTGPGATAAPSTEGVPLIWFHLLVVLIFIVVGARLGGIGVGLAGAAGVVVLAATGVSTTSEESWQGTLCLKVYFY